MSKETDNQSFDERNSSLTGNSGMLGLSSVKPKLQPVRIKAFLDMFGSDEEDSEDRGAESSGDSDSDDLQPLPEDPKEENNGGLTTVMEESSTVPTTISGGKNIPRIRSKLETELETRRKSTTDESVVESVEIVNAPISRSFGNNFSISEHRQRRSDLRESRTQTRSEGFPPNSENLCSKVKFEVDSKATPSVPVRIEPQSHPNTAREIFPADLKFEPREQRGDSEKRHSQSATSSETTTSSSSSLEPRSGSSRHLPTDTPIKCNHAAGTTRPVPSSSHRSIFQTPRNAKPHQDRSVNNVTTPATIFGNWSRNHMSQTPLENRSTPSVPPQIMRNTDLSSYASNEEKRVRRPLAETFPSVRSNRLSQNDKFSCQYASESLPTSVTRDNHERSVAERANDDNSMKSGTRDSKENRHPVMAEQSSNRDERERSRTAAESAAARSRDIPEVKIYEQRPQDFRKEADSIPAVIAVTEKKNPPERQNNVQVSIPSRVRRNNQGQIIDVKGKEYLILGTLGEGMSGHVLRVQEIATSELRAIKVVDLSKLDKDCAQGCLQEITMLHKLQAPCIVKMFDYEIKQLMVNVVLEMGDTDFKSLLNSMTEKSRLPLTMILYYWTEMLRAVKHIHDNGVIHSDLKPANFLLVRGRLKLIDFGIASTMNADMTSVVKNNPIGTLNYISPEALMDISGNNGDSPNRTVKYKISFKSDVWSLGCILYSLVYGYTPFHNIRAQWAKISAITNPNPKISFPQQTGNDNEPTPPILIDVMRKCLQHNPKARPTVEQLLQIPYIPFKQIAKPAPDISPNILMKIKYSLTDSEWRQFTEMLEAKRSQF